MMDASRPTSSFTVSKSEGKLTSNNKQSDDESEEEEEHIMPGDRKDEISRLRREKRLSMNRESARVRRKRKKLLIETLEQHSADIDDKNQKLRATNENLVVRVAQLENELSVAKSTISMLTQQSRGSLDTSLRGLGQSLPLSRSGFSPPEGLGQLLQQPQSLLSSQRGALSVASRLDLEVLGQQANQMQRERALLAAAMGRQDVSLSGLGPNHAANHASALSSVTGAPSNGNPNSDSGVTSEYLARQRAIGEILKGTKHGPRRGSS